MIERENRWLAALEKKIDSSTENVIRIMNRICDELNDATAGKVRARFVEVKLKTIRNGGVPVELVAQLTLYGTSETVDENALDLEDAGKLYEPKRYGFDIYNDGYTYRAFEASIGPTYPIKLFLDGTIARESREELSKWLSDDGDTRVVSVINDGELEEIVDTIINSRKMTIILHSLMNE